MSQPEGSRPVATAKATAKAVVAKPTVEQPSISTEDKQAELPSDAKAPASNTNHPAASNENSVRATTEKTTVANSKHAPASPAPDSAQAGNKSAVQAAGKRRMHTTDEKEPDDGTTGPAKASPANPSPSHSQSSVGSDLKPSKPEAWQSPDRRDIAESLSQPSAVSTAAQSHGTKEEIHPAILASTERPTTFASPGVFLPQGGDAAKGEVPAPTPGAAERAALVDRAVEDPGLSMNVLPHSAHLSIVGDTGDLSLHVRVRDGSADINVGGTMAPLFDAKAPELRTVLAGEGLHLGSFATDQRGGSQGQQGQPESARNTSDPHPLPPPRRATTATPDVHIGDDRRIHITA
jgi:hypothetical protein